MTELDLAYTPRLGFPLDAVQMDTQTWAEEHQFDAERAALAKDLG